MLDLGGGEGEEDQSKREKPHGRRERTKCLMLACTIDYQKGLCLVTGFHPCLFSF